MELVYPRATLLPNNYVEIEEEEMMYLEGGAYTGIALKEWVVASGINAALFRAIGSTIASKLDTYDNDWIGIYTGVKYGFYTM